MMTISVESDELPVVAGVELRMVQRVEYKSERARSMA